MKTFLMLPSMLLALSLQGCYVHTPYAPVGYYPYPGYGFYGSYYPPIFTGLFTTRPDITAGAAGLIATIMAGVVADVVGVSVPRGGVIGVRGRKLLRTRHCLAVSFKKGLGSNLLLVHRYWHTLKSSNFIVNFNQD